MFRPSKDLHERFYRTLRHGWALWLALVPGFSATACSGLRLADGSPLHGSVAVQLLSAPKAYCGFPGFAKISSRTTFLCMSRLATWSANAFTDEARLAIAPWIL